MRSAKRFLWASFFFLPLLFVLAGSVSGAVIDDYTPEVTARVVRISFIRGDVQIRRTGDDDAKADWERAALNLPIVEGDELATGANTVVEIQLDSYNHIRLWENTYLKFTTLRDEGIAVSISQGTMNFRALAFDKNKSYFEIDAPATTMSIERAGMYRIDAGSERSAEIRVTATEDGEAKVYTQSAGFTLRSGRTARIFIEGNYAGDYETSNVAARITDEFDEWVLQRDALAAKRLNEAYYDKYYDRDQFGAEDLNDYGEWIYTKKYGYVWKPYPNTTANYANWSPYRYGHWRWVPFYGWTWVNDEPWGWATYHHGRWIWDNNYWVWTPYANVRWRRSWWQPAMISIVTWNGRVIWFPLGYDDNYCDFNRGYGGYGGYRRNRRNNVTIINNNTTVIVNPPMPNPTNPNPSPQPSPMTPEQIRQIRRANIKTPPLQRIPFEAVVEVPAEEFGKQMRGNRTTPLATAKQVLAKPVPDETEPPPLLPEYRQIRGKMSKDILIENPRIDEKQTVRVRTGVGSRETGKSMNQKLETERIFGNRQPKIIQDMKTDQNETKTDREERRRTGAVNRRPATKQDDSNTETTTPPIWNPQPDSPTRTRPDRKRDETYEQKKDEEPVRQRPRREEQTPPIFQQPQQEKPAEEKPQPEERRRPQPPFKPRSEERREQPRSEPRQEQPRPQPRPEPKQEQPRPEPRREQPRSEPKREEPRPQPKQEEKPVKPSIIERKSNKDS